MFMHDMTFSAFGRSLVFYFALVSFAFRACLLVALAWRLHPGSKMILPQTIEIEHLGVPRGLGEIPKFGSKHTLSFVVSLS
jgi:hypothetical protein